MEPSKITGMTVDPGNGEPIIDVDTQLLALHDELTRSGQRRAANALASLMNVASNSQRPWQVREVDGQTRLPQAYNDTTRVMILEPLEEATKE